MNQHHLRGLFMLHCVNSDLTSELLEQLFGFDMSAQLNFWSSEDNLVGIYEHDYKRILSLLAWMEKQVRSPAPAAVFYHIWTFLAPTKS